MRRRKKKEHSCFSIEKWTLCTRRAMLLLLFMRNHKYRLSTYDLRCDLLSRQQERHICTMTQKEILLIHQRSSVWLNSPFYLVITNNGSYQPLLQSSFEQSRILSILFPLSSSMSFKYAQKYVFYRYNCFSYQFEQQLKNIKVDDKNNTVVVFFTPTIPNCTYITLHKSIMRQSVRCDRSLHPNQVDAMFALQNEV